MKLLSLLLFLPLVALAQPTFGPYPIPGGGSGVAQTNILVGNILTNGGANGQVATIGADGTTYWSNSVASSGGSLGTNIFNLNVTNILSRGIISPFPTWTRHIFIGNSRSVNSDTTYTNWPGYYVSNTISGLPFYAGATNYAVSGKSVEQMNDEIATYAALKSSGGTNAIFYICDTVVDALGLTNLQTTYNSLSNICIQLSGGQTNTVVLVTSPESSTMSGAMLGLVHRLNDWVNTNTYCDVRVNIDRNWSYATGDLSPDGLHYSEKGVPQVATAVFKALLEPRRTTLYPSQELHVGGFIHQYMNSDLFTVRGLSVSGMIHSDFPGWDLESSASGLGASLFWQNGQTLNLWGAAGANNFSAVASFTPTNVAFVVPVAAFSFATSSNSATASTAITFPATTVKWTNTFGINIVLYIDNTAVTGTAIIKNGQQVFAGLSADVPLFFKPGDYFSETYTVGTPTARWEPL